MNEEVFSDKSFEEETIPDEDFNNAKKQRTKLMSCPNVERKGPNINKKINKNVKYSLKNTKIDNLGNKNSLIYTEEGAHLIDDLDEEEVIIEDPKNTEKNKNIPKILKKSKNSSNEYEMNNLSKLMSFDEGECEMLGDNEGSIPPLKKSKFS